MFKLFSRSALVLSILAAGLIARADEAWLGLYLQGAKIGYVRYSSSSETVAGALLTRNENLMVIESKMLGSSLSMRAETTTWVDAAGRPVRSKTINSSSGRTQTVNASFGASSVIVTMDNNGVASKKTLSIPKGAVLEDDPTTSMISGVAPKIGDKRTITIFDPTTVTLIENTVTYRGKVQAEVRGQKFDAQQIDVIDPRATTSVFISAKGDLIKIEGPMGMEMLPESKTIAMSADPNGKVPDLALSTAIKTEPRIERPDDSTYLSLQVSGIDLKRMPSDAHQRVTGEGESWNIVCEPATPDPKTAATISEAAKQQPTWTKPSMHVPSDSPEFKKLAKKIVGVETNVVKAGLKIKKHVYSIMQPNAGIGVLRDASEILKTHEGVCRDYAILTATICRAANIPTRICSGLVSWDGRFYYHAWVEIWTGKDWLGLDSTRPQDRLTATHIKIAQGNVEDAFTFMVFDKATIKVLEVRYSSPGTSVVRRS